MLDTINYIIENNKNDDKEKENEIQRINNNILDITNVIQKLDYNVNALIENRPDVLINNSRNVDKIDDNTKLIMEKIEFLKKTTEDDIAASKQASKDNMEYIEKIAKKLRSVEKTTKKVLNN